MGTRADFYVGIQKPKWIGSIVQDGHPWNIPCKILIQVNKTMYEETVVDFLKMRGEKKASIYSEGGHWLWPWEDSQLTDYSYFFSNFYGKVVTYSMVEKIMFDPIQIVQGEDLNSARMLVKPTFPIMGVGYAKRTSALI